MKSVASIIFKNKKGEVLLYLRDNKPNIPFPHHWDLFGGYIEKGETPEKALAREVKEELDFDLTDFCFFKKYKCLKGDVHPNIKYVFVGKIDKPLSELTLKEGEKLQFFTEDEIPNLKIANILKSVIMDYLESERNK